MPTGKVIRLDTASCLVLCDGEAVRCTLPGKWRLARRTEARPIAVGDLVTLAREPTGDAVVERVEPRHGGKLSRKAAGDRDIPGQMAGTTGLQVVCIIQADKDHT